MEKRMSRIIAAGHICIDLTPAFLGRGATHIEDVLLPGKLINVGNVDIHTGGSVANTGLALKKLGADVKLMGKVGDDDFGRSVLGILEGYGASGGMIVSPGDSTSYSVVLAIPGIDRIFLHHPGANDTFTADDIPDDEMDYAALFHFGYPPIMRKMYEDDGDGLVAVLKKAKAHGLATSLDLAAVDAASDAGRADWEEIFTKALPYVDIFVPSIEELLFMLDRDRFSDIQKRAGNSDITDVISIDDDVRPLAVKCARLGAKIVLIKCGAPGMYLYTAGEDVLGTIPGALGLDVNKWSKKDIFEKSYVPDRILSGTGAGDTAIAAFLMAIIDGYEPEYALHLAAATGACAVTEYDALSGLRSFEELKRRIDAGWDKRD